MNLIICGCHFSTVFSEISRQIILLTNSDFAMILETAASPPPISIPFPLKVLYISGEIFKEFSISAFVRSDVVLVN